MNHSINVNNPSSKVALEAPSNLTGQQSLAGVGAAMQMLGGKSILAVEHTSSKGGTTFQQAPSLEGPSMKITPNSLNQSSQRLFSPQSSSNSYSPMLALIAIFDLLQQFAKESTSLAIASETSYAGSVQKGVEATKSGAAKELIFGSIGAAVTAGMGVVSMGGAALAPVYAGRPYEAPESIQTPQVARGAQGDEILDEINQPQPVPPQNNEAEPDLNADLQGGQQPAVPPQEDALDNANMQEQQQVPAQNQGAAQNPIENQDIQGMQQENVDPNDTTKKVTKRFTWGDAAFSSRIQIATAFTNGFTDLGKGLGQISSTYGQYQQQQAGAQSQKYQGIANVQEKLEGQGASSVGTARQTVSGIISDLNAIMEASANTISSGSQIAG